MITNRLTGLAIECIERGWMPDVLTRAGIRHLCSKRLQQVKDGGTPEAQRLRFSREALNSPIAPHSNRANEQHYEVPAAFFQLALGAQRKYSCCLYEEANTLDDAELRSLEVTCKRAGIEDGMSILELGCGWGSLTLYMARNFPNSSITAVSNSASQRDFILSQARQLGVEENLEVITADMNEFSTDLQFDRVVSIEMFEHMRNQQKLLERISQWLLPNGRLFVHIFCHRDYVYPFETEGANNWMGRYFFTGGMMPSLDLFSNYNKHLSVSQRWVWSGKNYERTSNDWLRNLDRHREEAMKILIDVYGPADAKRWFHRWRVFFMACAELFGMRDGNEWFVAHYLFAPVGVERPSESTMNHEPMPVCP